MSAEDQLETFMIYSNGFTSLDADRLAKTVRNDPGGRFEWAEISWFADGAYSDDNGYHWQLVVVLHSGLNVPFRCEPTPETLAADTSAMSEKAHARERR